MGVRVHWLPTGAETAEDARNGTVALMCQVGLNTARAGVIPGPAGAQPFALTSTGSLSCSVGPGQAILSPGATTGQGSYPVTVDAGGAGLPTVSFAAGGSLARTDVIYLQVQDTAEDGSGFTRGQIAVVQGVNGGAIPSAPAGTVALWQVPVPATATSINFATAVPVGGLTVALGGVMPSASSVFPGNAITGQVRARTDRAMTAMPGPLEVYDAAAWQPAVPASVPRGIVAAPASSTANSPSLGATETLDTALPTLTVSLVSGRRYRVVLTGAIGNGTAGDAYAVRIRDSQSASAPTNTSPVIAETDWRCQATGSGGRAAIALEDTFLCTITGQHTFGVFAVRAAGTGSLVILASAGDIGSRPRTLYVEDKGNV